MAQQMDVLPRQDQPAPGSKVAITLSGEQFLRLIASPVQRMHRMQDDLEFRVGEGKIAATAIDSAHVACGLYRLRFVDLQRADVKGEPFSIIIAIAPFVQVAATIDPAEQVELVIAPAAIAFGGVNIPAHKDRSHVPDKSELNIIEEFEATLAKAWKVTMAGKAKAIQSALKRARVLSDLIGLRADGGPVKAWTNGEQGAFSLPIDMKTTGNECEGIYSLDWLECAINQPVVASKLEWADEITIKLGPSLPINIKYVLGTSSSFDVLIAPRVEETSGKQDDEDED